MMPRQHSADPAAHGDTGAKGKVTEACHARMVGCSRIPGVPHDGGKAKEGLRATNNSDTEQTRASHTPHMHSSTGGRSRRYTFKACKRDGSSSSREVEEVVVHGSSREVVVPVHFRRDT